MIEKIIGLTSSGCVAIVAICNVLTSIFNHDMNSTLLIIIIVSNAIVLFALITALIYKNFFANNLFSDSFDTLDAWVNNGCATVTEEEGRRGISVCGHDLACITSVGFSWENIEITFKAKIITNCLGLVVRAQDEEEFFMFQIGLDKKITPHKRSKYLNLTAFNTAGNNAGQQMISSSALVPRWIVYKTERLNCSDDLANWADYKIVLKRNTIKIFINNKEVYRNETIIDRNHGRVGFRCYAPEKACVADIKVKQI